MPSNTATIQVMRLEHGADVPMPAYATDGAAGMDICAAEAVTILPGKRHAVATGLAFAIPDGYEVQVRPRSGLAYKHGIGIVNSPGTIDADYRGELKVLLVNLSDTEFVIQDGERIAQLVVARHEVVSWQPAEVLSETQRGAGGYGSTGVQ